MTIGAALLNLLVQIELFEHALVEGELSLNILREQRNLVLRILVALSLVFSELVHELPLDLSVSLSLRHNGEHDT